MNQVISFFDNALTRKYAQRDIPDCIAIDDDMEDFNEPTPRRFPAHNASHLNSQEYFLGDKVVDRQTGEQGTVIAALGLLHHPTLAQYLVDFDGSRLMRQAFELRRAEAA